MTLTRIASSLSSVTDIEIVKIDASFWLFFGALVGVMAFLLINIALNIRKVLLILIFVFVLPDSSGIDASGRSILALALLSGFSLARTTVLVLLGLYWRGLGFT